MLLSSHIRSSWTNLHTKKNLFRNLPISDLLKKALYNLIYPFLKGASVSYKLGRIVMWDCSFFPTPSYWDECKGAYFSLMQVFYLCISVLLLSPICMFESFLGFTEVLNHRFKSKIAEKTKELLVWGILNRAVSNCEMSASVLSFISSLNWRAMPFNVISHQLSPKEWRLTVSFLCALFQVRNRTSAPGKAATGDLLAQMN